MTGASSGGLSYFDASAFVKLILAEPESEALRETVGASTNLVAAAVTEVEVVRAVRRADPGGVEVARHRLGALRLLAPTRAIRRRAGELDPPALRALDAVHLSTALAVADQLAAFYCYDERLAAAAEAAGLPVRAPA